MGRYNTNADVMKLADMPDLDSGAERRVGSSPSIRTTLTRYYHQVNMESVVQESTGVRRVVDISLSKDEAEEYLGKVFKQAQQSIQLKGFRKGHVPVQMIRKMYGRQLEAEAFEEAAQQEFSRHVQEKDVNPIGTPVVTKMERTEDGGLSLQIVYEVMPEFELGEYKGIPIRRIIHVPTEEEIDQEIERVRENLAATEPAERAADSGHIVTIDLQKLNDGVPVVGEGATDLKVPLSRTNINPALRESLLNSKPGDTFNVDLPTGEDQSIIPYKVIIKEVERTILPDLDNDFAAKITDDPTATMETVRKMAAAGIASEYDSRYGSIFRDELIAKLMEQYTFDVPEAMIKIMLDSFVEDLKKGQKKELPPNFNREEHDREMRPAAERSARWAIVRDLIIEKEGLKAEEVDYEGLSDLESERTGIPYETLLSYFKQSPETADRIIAEKVIQLLEDYAIVQEIEDTELIEAQKNELSEAAESSDESEIEPQIESASDDDTNQEA